MHYELPVFFTGDDFSRHLKSPNEVVGRELRKLVGEGLLVHVGYEPFMRAPNVSVLSGNPIPSDHYPRNRLSGAAVVYSHSPKPSQRVTLWISFLSGTSNDASTRPVIISDGVGGARKEKESLSIRPERVIRILMNRLIEGRFLLARLRFAR